MKKFLAILSSLLVCSLMLCDCVPSFLIRPKSVMVIPDNDAIGDLKTFEIEGFRY